MLTNLVEDGKHKCVPYWKDSGSMNVGYFDVVVKDVTERADYIIRKIQITNMKSKKCKIFDHYHFTSWPDHGVPKVLDLLEFFWLTRETSLSRPGPVLNQYECIFTSMLEVVEYGQTSMTTSAYTLNYAELNGSLNMENIALDKGTRQSSYWKKWIKSSRAVDGRMSTRFSEGSCIHTGISSSFEWWQVDLGRECYIHKLTIHFRTDYRLRRNGVAVYSSVDGSPKPTGHLCGSVTRSSPDVMWMTCDDTARYITLYQDTYNSQKSWQKGDTAMNFCEVQVFETKLEWTDGSVCDSNHYGPLCEKSCPSRHCDESPDKSSCDKQTGKCVNGCTAGWVGKDCLKACDPGSFGKHCTQFCHCRDEPCNHVTGNCTAGCKPNWAEITCSVCDSYHYGSLCDKSCSMRHCNTSHDNSCDKLTGKCDNRCTPGWMEEDCTKNKYNRKGVTVYSSVAENQRNTGHLCGSINSTSTDVMWMTCDDTARYITFYRDNNNKDTSMDFCEVQIFECVSNHYGPLCENSCSSKHCNVPCNKRTGQCDNGCTAGWIEPDCAKKCSQSTYGFRCANNCNQRNCLGTSSCDHVTGGCDQGCDRGYQGEDCTTKCSKSTYGFRCENNCNQRNCFGTSSCDHVIGKCDQGCNSYRGYQGEDCTKSIAQTGAPDENPGPIIGGVIGTAVVVVVVAVIVVVFLK
ncbi:multiple epidermal growth factor-like domains protein 10 [Gigantopelta aegis]|uniref:multiple epidermal growth factor-like domains protein 10 n=1 Tax=Gigantopelta aegis TaxID=1735272 RepID=UPI001B88C96D|nr:multiple epidermal growth factor-like domains protein 10 [Gigantopelta aegis]